SPSPRTRSRSSLRIPDYCPPRVRSSQVGNWPRILAQRQGDQTAEIEEGNRGVKEEEKEKVLQMVSLAVPKHESGHLQDQVVVEHPRRPLSRIFCPGLQLGTGRE